MNFNCILFALFAFVISHPCVFEKGIDLRPLSENEYYMEGRGEKFDFLLKICGSLQHSNILPCRGDRFIPSILFNRNNVSDCWAISRTPDHEDDVKAIWIDHKDHEKGVQLIYRNGRRFQQDGKLLDSRTEIEIKCNKQTTRMPIFKEKEVIYNLMVYRFSMESPYACPNYNPNPVCTLNTPQGLIDLRKQAYQRPYRAIGRGFYDIILNICAPTYSCTNKMAPSVWVMYDDPNNCKPISKDSSKDNITIKLKNEQNPRGGVILTYLNGDRVDEGGVVLPTETEFLIECDENAPVDEKPSLENIIQRNGKHVYEFSLKSKFACPNK